MGSCYSTSRLYHAHDDQLVTTAAASAIETTMKSQPSENTLVISEQLAEASTESKDPTQDTSNSDTPVSSDGSLTLRNLDIWEDKLTSDSRTALSRTLLHHTDFRSVLKAREAVIENQDVFNHQLKLVPYPITDQGSSGRCWIFATTNVLRYGMMKNLNMKYFELSQAYIAFWDKLQKCNRFLERAIKKATCTCKAERCNVTALGKRTITDSGKWDMAADLLEKYGVVPLTIYPDSYSASSSSSLNKLLTTKLKIHALEIYAFYESLTKTRTNPDTATTDPSSSTTPLCTLDQNDLIQALRAKKEQLLTEIWSVMTATLGVPPRPDAPFTYSYYNKYGEACDWRGTPLEFYKQFRPKKWHPGEWIQLSNDPRYPYDVLYKTKKPSKTAYGQPSLKPWVNTDMSALKHSVITSIKSGHPVCVTCDIDQFSDEGSGVMDMRLYESSFQAAFNITLNLTKSQRMDLLESSGNHAMVISGVHLDGSGKPVRYKVENSWGDESGNEGYYTMNDEWFNEFVYDIALPKSFVPKKIAKILQDEETKKELEGVKKSVTAKISCFILRRK